MFGDSHRWLSILKDVMSAGVATCFVLAMLRALGLWEGLELKAYDFFTRLQAPTLASRVAIVSVSESDINYLNRYPLTDATIARALARILEYKPTAIGLDIYRDIPVADYRDGSLDDGPAQLRDIFLQHDNIFAVYKFSTGMDVGVKPPPVLEGTQRAGFNDVIKDRDGTVRRGLLFQTREDKSVGYAFALLLSAAHCQRMGCREGVSDDGNFAWGDTTIAPFEANDGGYVGADAGGYQMLLDYRSVVAEQSYVSIVDLLNGEVAANIFRDKVVLLGTTAESVPDEFQTPLSPRRNGAHNTFGVTLHAQVVDQLLRIALDGESPYRVITELQEVLWLLLWCLAGAALARNIRKPLHLLSLIVVGGVVVIVICFVLFRIGWWIPVVPPLLGWLISAGVVAVYLQSAERRERRVMQTLFAGTLPTDVGEAIWRERELLRGKKSGSRPLAEQLTATVMFTDLCGFTPISQKLPPSELMNWLDDYMDAMTQVIVSPVYDGRILQFLGDGIKVGFGVPFPRADIEVAEDARRAVRCALALQQRVIALNGELLQRGLPLVGMRIGLFTGEVVGGIMGSVQSWEYNVHGEHVNTAARLESFEKETFKPDPMIAPCRILIGATTFAFLTDEFSCEKVGCVALKGLTEKVAIYRVFHVDDLE